MKIVTSFSPERIGRQRYCLATWRTFGLPICAVQLDKDINYMDDFDVDQVIYTNKSGKAYGLKDSPLITELLSIPGDILVINSDISLKYTRDKFYQRWRTNPSLFKVGIRTDRWSKDQKKQNKYGIDMFLFPPQFRPTNIGYSIGSENWDYWVIMEARKTLKIQTIKDPEILHQVHEHGRSEEDRKTGKDLYPVNPFEILRLTGRQ